MKVSTRLIGITFLLRTLSFADAWVMQGDQVIGALGEHRIVPPAVAKKIQQLDKFPLYSTHIFTQLVHQHWLLGLFFIF